MIMLKKEIRTKILIMFALVFSIIWIGGTKAYAQTVTEKEPNDSKETAQLIQATRETVTQAASGNRPGQYYVYGNADINDTDWYKVHLTAGTQYVTCNDFDFNFCVYDENNNMLLEQSYSEVSFGPRAYPFDVNSDGFYYVKVQGITTSSRKYIIGVGDHTYAVAKCQINLGNVKMTENKELVRDINLKESTIPDGSIIYDMAFDGLRTSNAKYATINNITQNYTKSLGPSIYSLHNIATNGLKVKSDWKFTIGCVKNKAIDAKFIMYFVYPVTSEFLKNDEFIFNAY